MSNKTEISAIPYLKALKQYPYNNQCSSKFLYHITSVKTFEINETEVEVVIRTHFPGLLIGGAGFQINGIRELMEKYSNKKVTINLIEEDMFNNIYG